MKKLILISALLFSFNGLANLNLVCDGIATVESKAKGSTETCLHDPGVNPVLDPNCLYGKKIITTSKTPSEKRVPVSIDFFLNANEDGGWIDIPKSIRKPGIISRISVLETKFMILESHFTSNIIDEKLKKNKINDVLAANSNFVYQINKLIEKSNQKIDN